MAFFCENCGTKLAEDALFCENCGYKVTVAEKEPPLPVSHLLSVFSSSDWRERWRSVARDRGHARHGVILINTSGVLKEALDDFYAALARYMAFSGARGNAYCVLDLANQAVGRPSFGEKLCDVEFVVRILKDICAVASVEYLLILGDRDAIKSIKWKNPLHDPAAPYSDSDAYVDSDLPYLTLETVSPFENIDQSIRICVGRVPTTAASAFSEACVYLENVMRYGSWGSCDPFVLSAEEWENVSRLIFEPIKAPVAACPPNTFVEELNQPRLRHLSRGHSHQLLCFNLHGMSKQNYWLSGDGSVGYSPLSLPANPNLGYVICTQACYGAKPFFTNGNVQSILITALANRCLGFLGSSQIAYGITDRGLSGGAKLFCSDVVARDFSSGVVRGRTLGQSHARAIGALLEGGKAPRGESIKTLTTFALYGDPAFSAFHRENERAGAKGVDECLGEETRAERGGIHIRMPDVRAAVQMQLTRVSERIAKVMDDYVASVHSRFVGSDARYYKLGTGDTYRAVYARDGGEKEFSEILSIYFDKDGQIECEFISK